MTNHKQKKSKRKKKKTLHHEYFAHQVYDEKKYGKNKTVVLMQVGSFHEAYATRTRGHNLQKLS